LAASHANKKAGDQKDDSDQNEFSDLLMTYTAGEVVASEGEADSKMYLIERGQVELVKSVGTAERVSATLGPGEFFGELSVLEEGARHLVSARAADEVRVLPIDAAALDYILREQPKLALRLMQALASRLRGLEEQALRAQEIAAGALAVDKAPLPEAREVVEAVGGTVEVDPAEVVAGLEPVPRLGAVRRATLVHDESGQRFEINLDRESNVGRFDPVSKKSPDIDLQDLDSDHSLSRRHATFWFEGHCLLVREESGVANGTFIGGRRLRPLRPQVVEHGEAIRFGLVDLTLALEREEAPEEPG